MYPPALCCWLVSLLTFQTANQHMVYCDQRNESLSSPSIKLFPPRGGGSSKANPHNKREKAVGQVPEFMKKSPKFVHFFSSIFPVDQSHRYLPVLLNQHDRHRLEIQKESDMKGSQVKVYNDPNACNSRLRRFMEEPNLQKKHLHDSINSTGKIHRIITIDKVPGIFVGGRNYSSKINFFQCGPNDLCVCWSQEKSIRANCNGQGLTEFPRNLPLRVQVIEASHNNIMQLSLENLLLYPDLQEVYLSCNSIIKLTKFVGITRHPLRILDLDSNKLRTLDAVNFGVLVHLERIYLSKNKLVLIGNQLFFGLKKLRYLDLSYNSLTNITLKAFDHLMSLTSLKLHMNIRLGYSNATLSRRLFKPLQALKHLWIQGNSDKHIDVSYPNEALGQLTNLRELQIDGLGGGVELGHEIAKQTRLHSLTFGYIGHCFIRQMSSTFFQYVPSLKILTFFGCNFRDIENGTFERLHQLKSYNVKFPKTGYKFEYALRDLQHLPNKKLINLALIGFMRGSTKCRVLSGTDVGFLNRFQLRQLHLDFNYISFIDEEFIERLPKTLRMFALRGNKFTFISQRWNYFMNFTNLFEIDLRDQNIYSSIPINNEELIHSEIFYAKTSVCSKQRYIYCAAINVNEDPISYSTNSRCNASNPHQVCIPPNLKMVRASGFTKFGRALLHRKRSVNTLCYLDFSSGFFIDWGKQTLPAHTKIADFSDNLCDQVKPGFFPVNNELRYLCINNNYLGPQFSEDVNGSIFSHLHNLVYLDIAMNNVFSVSPAFFKGLKSLERLDMHDNKLQILDIDFSSMPNLREIDLSDNSITWISRRARKGLDALALNHSISINLRNNPLPCTCDGFEVLQWLANTRVFLSFKMFLACSSETEENLSLGKIEKRLEILKQECIQKSNHIIFTVFSSFVFSLIISALLYRYRWKLRYARNKRLVNRYGFRPKGTMSQRMYDAYVVYSEEDRDFTLYSMINELEVKRGHKLCVEDRNFIPGNFNFNNITCAIQNSTITVLLLSPDFLSTRELEYATQMALMEQHSGQEKRDAILLLRYADIDARKLSKDLLTLMKQGHFLDYPRDQDESIKQRFWDRVSIEIGHTQNTDSRDLLLDAE